MKKIIYILFWVCLSQTAFPQSTWSHVGPISENQTPDNGFETSQFDNIVADPNPSAINHLFATSWFGGLWETTNKGANWTSVDNNIMTSGGVSAVTFLSTNEILVSDYNSTGRVPDDNYIIHHTWSTGIWKYNFVTKAWTVLGILPTPVGVPFFIRNIAVYPPNNSIIFACTSVGLYRSTDGGLTWTKTVDGFIENMVFLPTGNNNFFTYVAGSTIGSNFAEPNGTLMVKESNNAGASFVDLSNQFTVPSPYNYRSVSKLCMKSPDISGVAKLYLLTIGSDQGFGCGGCVNTPNYLHAFTKTLTLH